MAGRLWVIGVLAALALAGCDGGDDTSTTATPSTQPTATSAETTAPAEDQQRGAQNTEQPQLYFTAGEQFEKVPFDAPAGGPEAEVEAATEALVEGPPKAAKDAHTQIPAATEVEGVEVAGDGTATVEV